MVNVHFQLNRILAQYLDRQHMRHFRFVCVSLSFFFFLSFQERWEIALKRDFLKRPWNKIMINGSASVNTSLWIVFWLKHSIDLPNYIQLHVYVCHGIIHTLNCRLNHFQPLCIQPNAFIVRCNKINIPTSICQSMLQTDGTHSDLAQFECHIRWIQLNSVWTSLLSACVRFRQGAIDAFSAYLFSGGKISDVFVIKFSFVVNSLSVWDDSTTGDYATLPPSVFRMLAVRQ